MCWLSACSTKPHRLLAPDAAEPPRGELPSHKALGDPDHVYEKLMTQYNEWRGVRYKLGGESKKGVDCSAFVQLTYRSQFGLKLPRTTSRQVLIGREVDSRRLTVGDLVFFKINRRVNHVGIYLGERKFLHASTSNGVMISNLDQRYWARRYWKAIRP